MKNDVYLCVCVCSVRGIKINFQPYGYNKLPIDKLISSDDKQKNEQIYYYSSVSVECRVSAARGGRGVSGVRWKLAAASFPRFLFRPRRIRGCCSLKRISSDYLLGAQSRS